MIGKTRNVNSRKKKLLTGKSGYSPVAWNNAKNETREILIERAKVNAVISYSELITKIRTMDLKREPYVLSAMLKEISIEEDVAGRGMLTVIVVHKDGDMQPGSGFFELARELGRDTSDILKCWVDESRKIYAYWSGRRR